VLACAEAGVLFWGMSAAEQLLSEVLALPEMERAKFAHRLLESLEQVPTSDVEAAWLEELERRVREVETGTVRPIPWETARADILAELHKRRATRNTP
jgi:putative addiction module component (TIGR02574 family)